jgi:hypothetical protein
LATFCWTKSLLCNDDFKQGFRYSECLQKILPSLQVRKFGSLPAVRTTCHTVWTSICPKHRPSRRSVIPSGLLPLCREVSNCSSLHPSRRFSSTSGRYSVFDKLQDFFPKHSYGKIAATVRTTWIPVRTRSSIRQVSQFKSRRPDDGPYGSDARTSDMEIACIK